MHKILIVEDDTSLRDLFTAMLSIDGYTIEVASDGQEALTILNKNRPDIVILDMNLPQVSGYEVIRYIRSHEQLRDLRVIILSANSNVPSSDEAELADVVLMKPVTMIQLQTMVKRLTGVTTGTLSSNGDKVSPIQRADKPSETTPPIAENNPTTNDTLSTPKNDTNPTHTSTPTKNDINLFNTL